jgi:CRISPR-associated protein
MITAPYNFVPLNEKVFYPPWASENILKNIHDVPFKDGESGVIEVEITAKSPIFIKDSKNRTEFCHFLNENGGKEYYIPATSVKGMIRNVLEIMSFGKIRIDESKHKKYLSVRDMTYKKSSANDMTKLVGKADDCGFLIKNGDSYIIEKCADVRTICLLKNMNYEEIEKLETAKEKYKKFGLLKEINFTPYDEKSKTKMGQKITIKRAKFDKQGRKGILVFTGNIDKKRHEFVFAKNGKKIQLDKNVFEDFKKVYFDNEDSIDGQYWKEQFNKGMPVPIFYMGNDIKITAIGLTQLFKLTYKKTIFEAAKQASDDAKFDLAETIFGTVRSKKALKGRVYFSHFKSAIERFEAQKTEQGIFGTPNPSYYPNYLEQNSGRYVTLMDANARIRGYKRYPLHSSIEQLSLGNGNKDMVVEFKPLPVNSVFRGKIVFHNLKKAEIGALLSAITFHGRSDKFMHNIGFAKPYGYGKIDIEISLKDLEHSKDEYLNEFKKQMDEFKPNWLGSEQIKELCEMASVKYKASRLLQYQQLENSKSDYMKNGGNRNKVESNEFLGAKGYGESLNNYSKISIYTKPIKKPNNQNHGNSSKGRR